MHYNNKSIVYVKGLNMRVLLFLCVSLVVVVNLASAADSITIDLGGTPAVMTIPAGRKANLNKLRAQHNRMRAAQLVPLGPLTLEQFVQARLLIQLTNDEREGDKLTTTGDADFCGTYKDDAQTTSAQRTQVITVGKGASPCP